jgi:CTP:molybdopterin cytidylyltransferase MocA
MLAAIILAGGESLRMGTPKALLEFRGRTFLEHLLDAAHHTRVGVRRVVLGAVVNEILERVLLPSSDIVLNSEWRSGQLSSLQAGLRSLPSETDGAIIFPVDHPLITPELVASLIAAFDAGAEPIVVPLYNGRRGHPVIFRAALYEELLRAPIEVGARAVVRAHANEVCGVPTTERSVVLNMNEPADVNSALKLRG